MRRRTRVPSVPERIATSSQSWLAMPEPAAALLGRVGLAAAEPLGVLDHALVADLDDDAPSSTQTRAVP